MRTRAFCVRYKGPAFQSELWTGVTNIGLSSHWSAVKCAPLNIVSGLSDDKIWHSYSYTRLVTWCCFPNDRLSYIDVRLISFILSICMVINDSQRVQLTLPRLMQ